MTHKKLHSNDTNLIKQDDFLDKFPLAKEVEISVDEAKAQFLDGKLGNTEVGKNQVW